MAAKNGSSPRGRARMRAFGELDEDAPLCELRPLFKRRPARKLSDLPENWRQIMTEAALQGQGSSSFVVYLGLNYAALNSLLRDEPEFAHHYEECLRVQKAWFENKGREMMVEGRGLPQIWQAFMVNQFGWKNSKAEVSGDATAAPIAIKFDLQNATDAEIDEKLGIPKF